MTQKQVVIGISIIGFILILSPFLGAAAQRAITVDSLEKAYISRVSELDAEINSLQEAINKETAERESACNNVKFGQTYQCYAKLAEPTYLNQYEHLNELRREREQLDNTYRFLLEALK